MDLLASLMLVRMHVHDGINVKREILCGSEDVHSISIVTYWLRMTGFRFLLFPNHRVSSYLFESGFYTSLSFPRHCINSWIIKRTFIEIFANQIQSQAFGTNWIQLRFEFRQPNLSLIFRNLRNFLLNYFFLKM